MITKESLTSHLYGENIEAITRGNNLTVNEAIAAGMAEAQSYLARYNISLLLPLMPEGGWGTWVKPQGFVSDANLVNKTKDLICWHLVKLANPNINLELFRTGYEDAIAWFEKVQSGKATPYGWPIRADDPNTEYQEGGSIQWTSNKKRDNQL